MDPDQRERLLKFLEFTQEKGVELSFVYEGFVFRALSTMNAGALVLLVSLGNQILQGHQNVSILRLPAMLFFAGTISAFVMGGLLILQASMRVNFLNPQIVKVIKREMEPDDVKSWNLYRFPQIILLVSIFISVGCFLSGIWLLIQGVL